MSDRLIVTGRTPVLSGPEVDEQLRGGTQTRYTWTGSYEECAAKRNEVRGSGADTISLRPTGDGLWQVVATYPGLPEDEGGPAGEEPTNQHELDINLETVTVWQSDRVQSYFTLNALRLMQLIWKHYEDGQYVIDSSYVTSISPSVVSTWASYTSQDMALADIQRLFALAAMDPIPPADFFVGVLFKGTDKVYRPTYNYRRSITAANWIQVTASFTGVGKIWTSDEVTSFEGIPTAEWFGLPTTLWLKMPPRVSAAAGGKTSIEYSYQGGFDTASQYLYEAYSGAVLS